MTPEQLLEQLRTSGDRLPGAPALGAAREAALAQFRRTGFPTRKLEDWRYTDISLIAGAAYDLIGGVGPADGESSIDSLLATARLDRDAIAVVLAPDGSCVGRGTDRLPAGIEIMTLAQSLERFEPVLPASALAVRPFAALNAAFASYGARVQIDADTQTSEPLHLLIGHPMEPDRGYQPQIVVSLGSNARADIVLHWLGDSPSAAWVNGVTKIELGAGSRLNLTRTQNYGPHQLHTELLDALVEADACLQLTCVDLGGRMARNDICVRLTAPGACCDLAGIACAADQQHIDNHISVEHLASHTSSEQAFRSIVGDYSRSVFSGKVVVAEGTRGISANQASDNLLLAETGEIDAKPELEINADDVKCSHGATVGELDESHLFYLRSRGIPAAAARGLLTVGFANEILARAGRSDLAQLVTEKFGLELPGDANWRLDP